MRTTPGNVPRMTRFEATAEEMKANRSGIDKSSFW
jgi:hypothetical protein